MLKRYWKILLKTVKRRLNCLLVNVSNWPKTSVSSPLCPPPHHLSALPVSVYVLIHSNKLQNSYLQRTKRWFLTCSPVTAMYLTVYILDKIFFNKCNAVTKNRMLTMVLCCILISHPSVPVLSVYNPVSFSWKMPFINQDVRSRCIHYYWNISAPRPSSKKNHEINVLCIYV